MKINKTNLHKSLGISPSDLGLPEKFTSWRTGQESALIDATECDSRFLAVSMPTGWGKSLWYIALAKLMGWRTCVLTSTKALQDQLLRDFSGIGMVDIRGRANYQCCIEGYTCEDGRHAKCPRSKSTMCPYRRAYEQACKADLVVTNYSYWIYQHLYGEGLGKFDLLVCDEAHETPEEICSAMTIHFSTREVYGMLRAEFPKTRSDTKQWRKWASKLVGTANLNLEDIQEDLRHVVKPSKSEIGRLAAWKELAGKLDRASKLHGEWSIEDVKSGIRLTPLWPAEFSERALFRDIPRVYLVSATVRPKTLDLLGVSEDNRNFYEYPPVFDPSHSPVYLCRTDNIQVNRKITPGQRKVWLRWIDHIIESRIDRKGIIHSVSYKNRDYIMENSEWKDLMITHDSYNAVEIVKTFQKAEHSLILVSPSVSTGWDFPYDTCRYQIIAKSPWPNLADKALMLRKTRDPEYATYMMAQRVVQACGRGNRARDDYCENFIVDWGFARFASRSCPANIKNLFPQWFWRLFHWADMIPARYEPGIY